MQLDQLRHCLESPEQARHLLGQWRLRDPAGSQANLQSIANAIGIDAFGDLCHPLGRLLPRCPDPDMALNNLERFLANPAAPCQLPSCSKAGPGRWKSSCNCSAPASSSAICWSPIPIFSTCCACRCGAVPAAPSCRTSLQAEVDAAFEDSAVLRAFRRFRQRQMLAHRHQRHHPRSAAGGDHPRHLARRRRRPGSRPGHRPAQRRQPLRRAVHRRPASRPAASSSPSASSAARS